MAAFDRTMEDTGNLVSLDHVNLTIGDQPTATLFYIVGLGLTRDPYMMVGLENMWLGAGRQQFHVPTKGEGQVIRGHIGMVVPNLDDLRERLTAVKPRLAGTAFDFTEADGYLDVTCPWGNRYHCTGPVSEFRASFGVPYIEFNVPVGTAPRIGAFYETVFGARTALREFEGAPAAVVHAGPDQSIVFREEESEVRPYDGHHIAVFVGDFSGPHRHLESRELITEESNAHQYRFTNIVDLESGELLYELEHEVRSLGHPMFGRNLVSRDPMVTLGNYTRSAEYLNIG